MSAREATRDGNLGQVKERALRRAYGRVYPTLAWEDASEVGRAEAERALSAEDVLAVLETDDTLGPETPDDLPFCVLTYRRGPNGLEWLDAIIQSAEDQAHDVAEALAHTGQPTWLFDLSEHEQHRYRTPPNGSSEQVR